MAPMLIHSSTIMISAAGMAAPLRGMRAPQPATMPFIFFTTRLSAPIPAVMRGTIMFPHMAIPLRRVRAMAGSRYWFMWHIGHRMVKIEAIAGGSLVPAAPLPISMPPPPASAPLEPPRAIEPPEPVLPPRPPMPELPPPPPRPPMPPELPPLALPELPPVVLPELPPVPLPELPPLLLPELPPLEPPELPPRPPLPVPVLPPEASGSCMSTGAGQPSRNRAENALKAR